MWTSILKLEGGRDDSKRLYLALLASIKKSAPAGNNANDPMTAKANDQLKSLCSQLGIQSRLSPLAPNISTETIPKNPAKIRSTPMVTSKSMYLSWLRLQ